MKSVIRFLMIASALISFCFFCVSNTVGADVNLGETDDVFSEVIVTTSSKLPEVQRQIRSSLKGMKVPKSLTSGFDTNMLYRLPDSLHLESTNAMFEAFITRQVPVAGQWTLHTDGDENSPLGNVFIIGTMRLQVFKTMQEFNDLTRQAGWRLYTNHVINRKDITNMFFDISAYYSPMDDIPIAVSTTDHLGVRGQISPNDFVEKPVPYFVCSPLIYSPEAVNIHIDSDPPFDFSYTPAEGAKYNNDRGGGMIVKDHIYLYTWMVNNGTKARECVTAKGGSHATYTQFGDQINPPGITPLPAGFLDISVARGAEYTLFFKTSIEAEWSKLPGYYNALSSQNSNRVHVPSGNDILFFRAFAQ